MYGSQNKSIISLHSINWLVFITETECVYCAVRTGSLYIAEIVAFGGLMCVSDVSLRYKGYCASMTNCISQAAAVCVQMQRKFRTVVKVTTAKVWPSSCKSANLVYMVN